jgi:hypothetical protein
MLPETGWQVWIREQGNSNINWRLGAFGSNDRGFKNMMMAGG